MRFLRLAFFLPILYFIWAWFDVNVLPTLYKFDPKVLQEVSQKAIAAHGNNTEALFEALVSGLREEYGELVAPLDYSPWFFNNAGGAMGAMIILHASISEYLIIFGTPLETEGHSGIHMANDYFTILQGEQLAFSPGELYARSYKAGEQNVYLRGARAQYSMPEGCWALELAQGWIPAMLPFGFADTFSSTLDWGNLWTTVYETARMMGRSALQGKF
ncbi:putative C-8 sterol isomerase [Saitoella complicata NRRL Y-17804]|uniref:C-8 sterol isomerase n=1 Tax=Saitoella complicata (strain BCRC 22490 / CBS 7301 / JCM 7358 / NBRC 10748 / NRRL Y-17804) TaxID=698492 RepID=A0A0E9NHH0_SAICN|nr:putative C-8 sterol isomerase [Saitoella complicata NRRL Y-17804]ODQ53317.1 putative C-8 sterol isomerase [Saitoella complicata NRRL Y-17804]GAO48855.1 hypothetical protein G7K_3021-t1 [Saitoella complicata NRRL Y-17804]